MKMTFAQWEKMVRFYDEFAMIHTEINEDCAVVKAWSESSLCDNGVVTRR